MAGKRSKRRAGQMHVPSGVRANRKPVTKRRIVYIAGYDPRAPEEAKYDLLKREFDRYCDGKALEHDVSDIAHSADGETASWHVRLSGEGWSAESEYLFLRWDDIVARDFARSFPHRVLRALVVLLDYLLTGTLWRMARAFHRTPILWLYPFVALAAIFALAALAWQFIVSYDRVLGAVPPPYEHAIGAGAALLIVTIGAWLTRRTFIQHLTDLWCFCRDYARGTRPDMDARCARFADHVLEAVRRDDVDETLLIGHSYGAMMMVEAVAHALARDEAAFDRGAPVVLVTLGSCINTSTLRPGSTLRRDSVKRVAQSKALLWTEIQSRQDLINFYQDDAGKAAGLAEDSKRPNPIVRLVSITDMLSPPNYRRFRFNYFRIHYQTICANDYPHPWDYILVAAGPDAFAVRMSLPHWDIFGEERERYGIVEIPILAAFSNQPAAPSD